MNKWTILTCGFFALVVSSGLTAADKSKPAEVAQASSGDTTIATINEQKIPLDLFRRFYLERLHQTNTKDAPALQSQVFNEFVNVLVTAQDAQKKGLDKEKGFALALELQRLQLLSRFAIRHAANAHQPSDKELRKAYDESYGKEKGIIEYKARHILVKTEAEGKKLIKKLKGGADFAELAKTHSLGPTGKNGGDLLWFGSGRMEPAFTEATAALKPGKYSNKPVQTKFGWHVILLEETRETKPPALADVKNELTLALQRSTVPSYIAGLHDQAKVELNSDVIKMVQKDKPRP